MIKSILNLVRSKLGKTDSYWEKRAANFGKRAVLNLGHGEDKIDDVTKFQIEQIFSHLRSFKNEMTIDQVLDYGCGPGRFSIPLADYFDANVTAVDPIRRFLELAPKSDKVEYLTSKEFRKTDKSFDFIWICLVLGGLSDDQILKFARLLEKHVHSGTAMCLVENTSTKKDQSHWRFRSADYYQTIFERFNLSLVGSYDDLGEEISIMIGKKK